jgi:signal transduction histidine kinase/ActR/RegA family two-component response regulator
MRQEQTVFRLADLAELGALALRRQVNDLFALLELPSAWQGLEPGAIAESARTVLLSLLRLDVALLRFHGPEAGLEQHFPEDLEREALLAVGLGARPDAPATFVLPRPNTVGRTAIRVVSVCPVGEQGCVIVGSWRENFPTPHERHLLQATVNQAALAMQSSREARTQRRLAEERALLERVNASLAMLQAISEGLSRAHTSAQVADVILSQGLNVLGAHGGALFLADEAGAELRMVGAVGLSEALLRDAQRIPVDADRPLAEAFRRKTGLFCSQESGTSPGAPGRLRLLPDTYAAVSLMVDARCLGVLGLAFPRPRGFTEEERAFIHAIAQQAAQACDRARLLEAERRARLEAEARQQRADVLSEASALLGSSREPLAALQRVAELLVPRWADWVVVQASERTPSGADEARTLVVHREPARAPLAREWGLSLLAAGREPRSCVTNNSVLAPITAHGQVFGALVLGAEEVGRYGPDTLELTVELGQRMGVALENARLYQEAREADRRKDEFLAMLGHELRNPLSPIVTALHLMRKKGGAFQSERTVIERQVEHLVRLVDDLLDVSRITRGKLQLQRERVDLLAVLDKAVEMVGPLLEQRTHRLEQARASEPLDVDGDPARLAQVLANLLNNAAKYTDPGGQLRVSAQREGGQAVLRVRDNGTGLGPEVLPRVFEMFFQEGRSIDRSQGGLGLGLALVRSLVEMHGGTVSAHSEGRGRGSEFVVRLPLATPRAAEAEAHRSAPPEVSVPAEARAVRLLVVDDNRPAARTLTMLLELEGFITRVAHDGAAGLEAARAFQPQVALLDIGLPVMDGYALAARLRQEPTLAGLKLVALTGYGQDSDRRRAEAAGFDRHLVKPVRPELLLRLLSELLEGAAVETQAEPLR